MNSKQHKILEMFKRDILEHDGNGPRFMDRYEFKLCNGCGCGVKAGA